MSPAPSRASATVPRRAVSVLMLRGEEIFIQNRSLTMDFAAGVVVFPGGRVDDVDRVTARAQPAPAALLEAHALCWAETSVASGSRSDLVDASGVLLAAAVREVQEETGAVLSARDLMPWANWITPPNYGKRFDTYFYLTVVASSLDPQHRTSEADSSHWSSVRSILAGAAEGRLELMRPTEALLRELADLPGSLPVAIESVLRAPRRITPVGRL